MDSFAARLLAWFEKHGRHDLPWQRNVSAYSVWVSEIMLQQTQVTTAIPYFEAFMRRFPDVASLAAASEDDALAHWSGLGYYSRARNLRKAAIAICADHAGELPATVDGLMALPGIGRSTAGAIQALARGKREAILDGNVKRVLARFHAIDGWAGIAAVSRELWARAEEHTPSQRVDEYTQAIMDLGATLCTRSVPRCPECPVAGDCEANRHGLQASLPARKPKPLHERRRKTVAMLVVRGPAGALLLERRPSVGIWGGLFSFPELDESETPHAWAREHLGVALEHTTMLDPIAHAFSHFDLDIEPVLIELDAEPCFVRDRDDWHWYRGPDSGTVGMPAPVAALVDSLMGTHGRTIA